MLQCSRWFCGSLNGHSLPFRDGKMDREAVRGGQVVPPRARAATDAGAGAGGAGAAAAPRAASTRAPRAAGGKGRGGRRGGRADEDDTDEEAAGDEDAEATYAGNRWVARLAGAALRVGASNRDTIHAGWTVPLRPW